ncbi:MAG: PKD domain-containing protein [Leeuwenhoekiella sp.]
MRISIYYNFLTIISLFLSVGATDAPTITTHPDVALDATISARRNVCLNANDESVTFTGIDGDVPFVFTYKIDGGADQTVSSATDSDIANLPIPTGNAATFNYELVSVEDASGNTAAIGQSINVTVNAPPTVNFSFDNTVVCSGEFIDFTANVSGSGPFTYLWEFGDGGTSTEANPAYAFTALGCNQSTFEIVLTITDDNGCSSKSATKTIDVLEKPDIAFNDDANPFSPFNNCDNASVENPGFLVTLANVSASMSCVSTYTVDWGDGDTETNATFPLDHNYTDLGTYTATVSAVGTNGCLNSVNYLIQNVINPSGGLNSPGNTQNICAPTAQLNFSITNWAFNSLDTTYEIDYGDGTRLTLFQPDLVGSSFYNAADPENSQPFPIPHSYTESSCPQPFGQYTVSVIISNACATTPVTVSGISVLSPPAPEFEVDEKICAGSEVLFENYTSGSFGRGCSELALYTWDFGDGTVLNTGLSDVEDITHTYTTPGNYTVRLTAENSCGIQSYEVPICVEPPLSPAFDLSTTEACAPATIATTNTTDLSQSCGASDYLWEVSFQGSDCEEGTGVWSFANGTDENSQNPEFLFEAAGDYQIKLTESNICGDFDVTENIQINAPPKVSLEPLDNSCGPRDINPVATTTTCSASSEPIAYTWTFTGGTPSSSNQQDPGSISYTAPGEYTVTLVAENSCGPSNVASQTFTITEIPTLTNTELTQTICSGTSSGPIMLTSDVADTMFEWNASADSGISGFQASGTAPEIPGQILLNSETTPKQLTYTVTPSKDGCPGAPVVFTITVEPTPTFTRQPAGSEVCINGTPDELVVEISDTDPSITYQWYENMVANTNTGNLIPGAESPNFTPPTGTPGTTYYYAVVSFATGGCNEVFSDVAEVIVNESLSIAQQPIPETALCAGDNLPQPLEVVTSGGLDAISYQWFENPVPSTTGGTPVTGATGPTYTPAGLTTPGVYYYYVEITSADANCGNAISDLVTITVATDPVLLNQPAPQQEYCQNATPLELEVVPDGDLNDYTYIWYENTIDSNSGGTPIGSGTLNTLLPPTGIVGTFYYYAEVSTATSPFCTTVSETATVVVTDSPTLTQQPESSAYCLGDMASELTVAFQNGTGTPMYQWYSNISPNTSGGTPIPDEEGNSYTPDVSSTGTRYYYVILNFPEGGCSEIISEFAEVTVNPVPEITNKTDLICSGATFTLRLVEDNGQVIPAGTRYTWEVLSTQPAGAVTGALDEPNGQTEISQTLTNTTDAAATVTYRITPFTTACPGSTFDLEVTVNPGLQANITVANLTCFGENDGALSTSISGGIPFGGSEPYLVNWTGPNGYTSTEISISGLEAGEYILEITDEGGCPFSESYTIEQPEELLIATENEQNISCFEASDGAIALNITGGSESYTYFWTKDGEAFSSERNLDGLAPGTYEVTVSDGTGCAEKTETFTIIEPELLDGTLDAVINVVCFGENNGAINVTLSGGTAMNPSTAPLPYAYNWSGPNGFSSSEEDLSGVEAGTYDLVVTDANGCTVTLQATVTQPEDIVITKTITTIVCDGDNNGSIDIALSGGVPPYNVTWSNFAEGTFLDNLSPGTYTITVTDQEDCEKTEDIIIEAPPTFRVEPLVTNISCFGERDGSIALNFQGGSGAVDFEWADDPNAGTTRNNLAAGSYTISISDESSCTINETYTIIEPSGLTLSASIDDAVDCTVGDSGSIDLIVGGGTTPYTFAWSNGSTTEDLTNLTNGEYSVTVTDASGCAAIRTFNIYRPEPLESKVETFTDADCEAMQVFQEFKANASGGVPPYTYTWSRGTISGENGEVMTTEENGFVELTATDQLGCESTTSFDVDFPETIGAPDFTFTSGFFQDFGFYSVFDDISFANLTLGDYVGLSWNFGDGSISTEENPVQSYVSAGTYNVTLTVTYPFGCIYEKIIPIIIEDGYRLIVPNAFTPNEDGMNDRFKPEQLGLEEITLSIYDTWGNMLFTEKGQTLEGWDGMVRGRLGENGNYHYRIFGTTFYDKEISQQGTLILIN